MSDLVGLKLLGWKSNLIDLSFRNPLLNFKPRKRTTLEVVSEIPSEVFRTLFLDEKNMEFSEGDPNAAPIDELEFRSYDRSALPNHYVDKRLQTSLDHENLALQLVAIYRKSREWIEERGVNALYLALGILEYVQDQNPETRYRAPLVLLPVELERPALNKFHLKSTGESPFLNPALRRKLESDFRIELPEIPENVEQFVPEAYFVEIKEKIAALEKWRITNHLYLSFFYFQKFLMYKDLEENEEVYLTNRSIQEICGEIKSEPYAEGIFDVSPDDLIDHSKSFQVLDSDSSQQRVLLAFRTGRNMVVEGPPGTGKSQTIVNLIAEALGSRKSVLFVSEKKAALDVVFRRLQNTGLGDFCLELHSNKTTRREVLNEIARTFESAPLTPSSAAAAVQELTKVSAQLKTVAADLHSPFGNTGRTPYQFIGEIAALDDAPSINATIDSVENLSLQDISGISRLLKDYEASIAVIGEPDQHPWFGCELNDSTPLLGQQIIRSLQEALKSFNHLHNELTHLSKSTGTTMPASFGEMESMFTAAELIANSPGAVYEDLLNSEWDEPPAVMREIINAGRIFQDLDRKSKETFGENIFEDEVLIKNLASRCQKYANSIFSTFSLQFLRDRKFLKQRSRSQSMNRFSMAAATKEFADSIDGRKFIEEHVEQGRQYFNVRWNGIDSNWQDLEHYAAWMAAMRAFINAKRINENGIVLASHRSLNAAEVKTAIANAAAARSEFSAKLNSFLAIANYTADDLSNLQNAKIASLYRRLVELADNDSLLNDWLSYRANRKLCLDSIAADLIRKFHEEGHPYQLVEKAFRKRFYELLLDGAVRTRSTLQRLNGSQIELRIEEFRRLDKELMKLASKQLVHLLKSRFNELTSNPELQSQWNILSRYFKLKRIKESLRKIFNKVPGAIRIVKPCFLMSPLSVAEYLNPQLFQFDVVIFDEASQVTPEDAVGSIIRGKQVIVVGDSRQLPPTTFFNVQSDDLEDAGAEYQDLESILDECKVACGRAFGLKWHYRSRDESLIAFSNRRFYDANLFTFPHANANSEDLGLSFRKVMGVYEGSGVNQGEARAIADAVIEHIRTRPERSLGVATFGVRQMELIRDLIDQTRRQNPDLESFFQNHVDEPFFVKNLETIQGDERDVIFLSVGYGPDEDGRMSYNFGPVNGENGWRRLNVLFTRAKYRMVVFSTISGDEMNPPNRNSGASLLKEFLTYAETGNLPAVTLAEEPAAENVFEEAVKLALIARGLNVISEAGNSGYKIDLAVVDSEMPRRFLLGIECYGRSYGSSTTVRDRNRLRQEALEDRDWKILRIWPMDWYRNPETQIRRVIDAVNEAKREISSGSRKKKEFQSGEATKPIEFRSRHESDNHLKLPKYVPASITRIGTPDSIHSDESQIKDVIFRVVSQEGPIHMDEARKRVAMHWGISRISVAVAGMIDRQIESLCEKDTILRKGKFLRIKGTPVQPRNYPKNWIAEYIAPEEYVMAARLVLEAYGPKPLDDLLDAVGQLMGFEQRAGDQSSECISRAINWMIENNLAGISSGRVHLLSR